MNVRDVTVSLRPRRGWESLDLGMALTREHYKPLFQIGLRAFIFWILLACVLAFWLKFAAIILIWWLKPIMNRYHLYYLSRQIFGEKVTVRDTLRKRWEFWGKGGGWWLTFLRFKPTRSMELPVGDLERLRKKDRRARTGVVTRDGGGMAFLSIVMFYFVSCLLWFSLWIFFSFFVPDVLLGEAFLEWFFSGMFDWFFEGEISKGLTYASMFAVLCYGFVVLLIEPFYSGVGFGLYLNSRTTQEVWDVELYFRELAQRVKKLRLKGSEKKSVRPPVLPPKKRPPVLPRTMLGVLACCLFFGAWGGLAPQAVAQDPPQEVVDRVLSHEDFTIHYKTYKERVRNPKRSKSRSGFWDWLNKLGGADVSGLGVVMQVIFGVVKILALLLLVAVIGLVAYHLLKGRNWSRDRLSQRQTKRPPPKMVMGMAVTKESLPEDILGEARRAWSSGQPRLALSLLYRGALTKLILENEMPIEEFYTEKECLKVVRANSNRTLADFFGDLTRSWSQVAYSDRQLADQRFQELCSVWPFSAAGSEGRRQG